MVAMNITDAARQRALLQHYAGEDRNEIFDTLPNTEAAEDENTLTKAIDALTVCILRTRKTLFFRRIPV